MEGESHFHDGYTLSCYRASSATPSSSFYKNSNKPKFVKMKTVCDVPTRVVPLLRVVLVNEVSLNM